MINSDGIITKQNALIHFFKKIGFLLLLLPTILFSWYYKNDRSYSFILGDSSNLKILLINFGLCLCYLIFIMIEAIKFNKKKQYKLRNTNLLSIPFILIMWFIITVISGKIIPIIYEKLF